MLFYSACLGVLAFFPAVQAIGGQIPIVEGVTGGVPTIAPASAPQVATVVATTPGKLRVVENSGICGEYDDVKRTVIFVDCFPETTPGVYQASGYGDLTATESIWCVSDFFQSKYRHHM